MKLGVQVEIDLSTIDSKVLLETLEERGIERRRIIIAAWKEGMSLNEIDDKFGDYGVSLIKEIKDKREVIEL